jgi:AraC-like DNA-binding protein
MDAEDIIAAVTQEIRTQMRGGPVSVGGVACALGMSVRTLQRMLQREGTDFRGMANLLRCEEAVALLGQTDLSVAAISLRLGYSSPANFARAFRAVTGSSPHERRRTSPDAADF